MKNELMDALIRYLDCPCRIFEPMYDDIQIMNAYREAQDRGKKEGFIPVMTIADDVLWESLIMGAGENYDAFRFNADHIAAYRRKMLSLSPEPGKESLDRLLSERKEDAEDNGYEWAGDNPGEMENGVSNNAFYGYWDHGTKMTSRILLAEVPVKNPWEIFAWFPFGGWNECPDTPELMAVSKYWYETHGAVPAVITHATLEYAVLSPVSRENAMRLASEQYAWCPDIVDQAGTDATIGMLADSLAQSSVWFFWWD